LNSLSAGDISRKPLFFTSWKFLNPYIENILYLYTILKGLFLNRKFLLLTLIFFIFTNHVIPVKALPPVVNSEWTYTPPTINGIYDTDEWDHAYVETISLDGYIPATLYVMNDQNNLYLALEVQDDDTYNTDEIIFYFDNNNFGTTHEIGDDRLYLFEEINFFDMYKSSTGWSTDPVKNGMGRAAMTTGGKWFFELSHPLNSSDDAHDFSLTFGSTVGFLVQWNDWEGMTGWSHYWPVYIVSSTEDWADLVIASPPKQVNFETVTDTGTATLEVDTGGLCEYAPMPQGDLPLEAQASMPNVEFPHGLLNFTICNLPNPGDEVTIVITLPDPVTEDMELWKWGPTPGNPTNHWYEIPIVVDTEANTITFSIIDGGKGDDDLIANRVIVDQNGPGQPLPEPEQPTPVGGDVFSIEKLAILTPYFLATIVLLAATSILIKKRNH